MAGSKDLVWLVGKVKTPPLSKEARRECGLLLRRLQEGERLSLPHSRPMPVIGVRCHELRIIDRTKSWRLVYRLDEDAVVVVHVFEKRTQTMPKNTIDACQKRLKMLDEITK